MALTTIAGDTGTIKAVSGEFFGTYTVLNHSGGPGVLRSIYLKKPSNSKGINMKITTDGTVIFDGLLEEVGNVAKKTYNHSNYEDAVEVLIHFTNSIDVIIYGIKAMPMALDTRIGCSCILKA